MKRPIIGVVTGLAILGVSASAVGQSLAEVARKEQERRKAVKEPGKVYTNDTIAASPAPPSPEPAPARSDTAKAQDTDKAAAEKKAEEKPTTGEVRDEKYWRSRITAARMQLERNNIFLEALQSRVNALTNDFTARDDPAQRALIGEDRQRALAEMERVRLEVENLKKEIAAIEEEARRENVPPGWLR
jgi:hypothetical protein